ncbi:hypothetical protein [Nonomuraea sp. NPDC003804]|uniref:hypothetical protein n=1 Tax=Nonomuraea sp. NPDC003804 TaxID=3154547 RepID=UPI0033ADF77C
MLEDLHAAIRRDPALYGHHKLEGILAGVSASAALHAASAVAACPENEGRLVVVVVLPATGLLVRAMRDEHVTLWALADELASATTSGEIVSTSSALNALFQSHLHKENDVLLPALADHGVDLAALLGDAHEILGEPAAGSCCGCGGTEDVADVPVAELDVRRLIPARRHEQIFAAYVVAFGHLNVRHQRGHRHSRARGDDAHGHARRSVPGHRAPAVHGLAQRLEIQRGALAGGRHRRAVRPRALRAVSRRAATGEPAVQRVPTCSAVRRAAAERTTITVRARVSAAVIARRARPRP